MDIIHELTEADCEVVAGGRATFNVGQGGGGGVDVAKFNHVTGTGPGGVLHNGPLVSFEVHAAQSGTNNFSPELSFFWIVPFLP